MRTRIRLAVAGLAIAVSAATAGAAFAAGFDGGPAFAGANTGPAAGAHVFTASGGAPVFTCTTVTAAGSVAPSPVDAHGHPTTAAMTLDASGCTVRIAGLNAPVTVSFGCPASTTVTSFLTSTGASTGAVITQCSTTITLPAWSCVITVPPTSVPVTRQNHRYLAGPPASWQIAPPASTPNALVTTINASGIPIGSSTCPGVSTASTLAYVGKLATTGMWVVD